MTSEKQSDLSLGTRSRRITEQCKTEEIAQENLDKAMTQATHSSVKLLTHFLKCS